MTRAREGKGMIYRRIGLGLLVVLWACAGHTASARGKAVDGKTRKESAAERIRSVLKNPDYFSGEWTEKVRDHGGSESEAIQAARTRACAAMAQEIEVEVVKVTTMILESDGKNVRDDMSQQIKTYTDKKLSGVEYEEFRDHPRKGECTVLAFLAKADYAGQVRRDLDERKHAVLTRLNEGLKAEKAHDYGFALGQYAAGLKKYGESFGKSPLNAAVTGHGKVEVGELLDSRVTALLGRIEIEPRDPTVRYGTDGLVTRKPRVRLLVREGDGFGVVGASLMFSLFPDKGTFASQNVVTSAAGWAEIPLQRVEGTGGQEVLLTVSLDTVALGLGPFSNVPSAAITLLPIRGLALCVKPDGGGATAEAIRTSLAGQGCQVMKVNIAGREPDPDEVALINRLNAGTLFLVLLDSSCVKDEVGMFTAAVGADVKMYRMPEGSLEAAWKAPRAGGKGVSRERALAKALAQVRGKVAESIRARVAELK